MKHPAARHDVVRVDLPVTARATVAVPTTPGGDLTSYRKRLIVGDLCVALVVTALAFVVDMDDLRGASKYAVLATPLLWLGTLTLSSAYERRFLGVAQDEMRAMGRALTGLLATYAVVGIVMAAVPIHRDAALIVFAGLTVGGVLSRLVGAHWLRTRRRSGQLLQRTLVIGRADSAAALIRSLRAEPEQGLLPVAVCAYEADPGGFVADVPLMGSPEEATAVAKGVGAQVVAVASHPDLSGPAMRRLTWLLEKEGIDLVVAPGLLDVAGPRMSIRPSHHLSLLHVERPAAAGMHAVTKSLFDRCAAALGVLVLSPVLLAIALAIRLDSRGPVIFRQTRVGAGNKDFTIFKFRTMSVDAEARLAALREKSEGNDVLFKMKNDPRITGVGRFLRKYSLDELPQLFNVVLGTMSLVGPRPPLRSEVDGYEPDALRRLNARPGMTGLWQVSGRSDLSWEDSVRLDLRYVDNWSPLMDLTILLRTVRAVFAGSGAY